MSFKKIISTIFKLWDSNGKCQNAKHCGLCKYWMGYLNYKNCDKLNLK